MKCSHDRDGDDSRQHSSVDLNHDLGKGVWHDTVNTGYIALDLKDIEPQPEMKIVEGVTLSPKNEYHCSLVAVRKYVEEPEYNRKREQFVAAEVKKYLQTHDLRYAGLGDERYLCRKDDRMTIVAPVRIDGIEDFVAFVRKLIPGYQPPFLHVTLLKSETAEHGISINSMNDLQRYCEKLTP